MPRPRLEPGTWGVINITTLPDGRYQARGHFRELDGRDRRPSAIAETPEAAAAALRARTAFLTREDAYVSDHSTVDELALWWLDRKHALGALAAGTLENYTTDAKHVVAHFGQLRLSELSIARSETIIRTLAKRDAPLARRVHKTLKAMLADAVRIDARKTNPLAALPAPRLPKAEIYTLAPEQAAILSRAYREWLSQRDKPGPTPDPRIADMLDVLLAVGLRIGELLALRQCDLQLDNATPTLHLRATLTEGKKGEPIWQPHPKAARQRRTIVLPSLAVTALGPYVDGSSSRSPVFPNRSGGWTRTSNVRRILRSFRDEWSEPLERAGIRHGQVTAQLLRRTLATLIANEAGIYRATEQLGHASVLTTERHYVTPAPVVGEASAALIDSLFGAEPAATSDGAAPPAQADDRVARARRKRRSRGSCGS